MKIVIEPKTSLASGNFGASAGQLLVAMEGRKQWLAFDRLRFETSAHNIETLTRLFPAAAVVDTRLRAGAAELLEATARTRARPLGTPPGFVMEPMPFQLVNFDRFKDKPQWAIFSEQGTGKTKVAFDIISHRYRAGTVTGVIVFSSPKGVHAQWIEEQLPKHLWKGVRALTYVWDGKKPPEWLGSDTDELQIFSGNIDMLKSKGAAYLDTFARHHRERLLILVDESDSIKSLSSLRSKKLRALAAGTKQRAIMTGTPIAKDLTDEWAQFYFLNPDIIGHKYLTSFRAQYCRMGGFENKVVVGHRNIEQFKAITAPYIFRAMKSELGLPPKVYDEVVFDLGATQRRLIKELKDNFFASLGNGASVAVKNGAVALLRMQQIASGFTSDEDGKLHLIENPRSDALLDLRRNIGGPVIIWCRFKQDVKSLAALLPGSVTYFGESGAEERIEAKEAFLSGRSREFIATPGSAGKGVDGLQRVCSDAIYYTNSYNAIDRWQSEDRIHRIGTPGTATYFDLIGRGSPDRAVLANLRRKKDISSLALDDIKDIMKEL